MLQSPKEYLNNISKRPITEIGYYKTSDVINIMGLYAHYYSTVSETMVQEEMAAINDELLSDEEEQYLDRMNSAAWDEEEAEDREHRIKTYMMTIMILTILAGIGLGTIVLLIIK